MIEIRTNIRGEVPPFCFFIPMPVQQWRQQTAENTVDLTMDLDLSPPPRSLTSMLPQLPSPFRNAQFPPETYWHDWVDFTATPPTSPCPPRSTRMAIRTCTPVCCCPSRLELSELDTGISKDTTRMCKESGVSQSGSLI